jgi:hypothetical protein
MPISEATMNIYGKAMEKNKRRTAKSFVSYGFSGGLVPPYCPSVLSR